MCFDMIILNFHSIFLDMVRKNLDRPPKKKAQGITINEGRSGPPKKKWQELPPGDKGKQKKNTPKEYPLKAEMSY